MAKIIEITAEHVSIGMDDGSIREIRPSDVSFIPQIGDEVEIYETENRIIVQKKSSAPQTPEGGIHINVANTNQTPPQVLVSGGKVVNKVIYCVLALFLGGIGVHKFYAGPNRHRNLLPAVLLDFHSRNYRLYRGYYRSMQARGRRRQYCGIKEAGSSVKNR